MGQVKTTAILLSLLICLTGAGKAIASETSDKQWQDYSRNIVHISTFIGYLGGGIYGASRVIGGSSLANQQFSYCRHLAFLTFHFFIGATLGHGSATMIIVIIDIADSVSQSLYSD